MQAIKITSRAKDWLITTDQFRVLHDFDQVVTLINGRGEVLTVHTADIGMGPFSLQVPKETFLMLKVGGWTSPVRNTFGFLEGENLHLWVERPEWEAFSAERLTELDHKLPFDIEHAMIALHQAILENSLAKIDSGVQQLVGRGVGLTPTGDDVLMGTIFALHAFKWDPNIISLIGKQTIGRTTSLSAAFLQAAVAGEATEPWHNLIAGEPDALEELLSVGATSGKDAWKGFVACCKQILMVKGQHITDNC